MHAPDAAKVPELKRAWDDYGHAVPWADLIDIKRASTHHYVALAWYDDKAHTMVNYADLTSTDRGKTWEFQNDGHSGLTLAEWKAARVKPDCDWLIDNAGNDI